MQSEAHRCGVLIAAAAQRHVIWPVIFSVVSLKGRTASWWASAAAWSLIALLWLVIGYSGTVGDTKTGAGNARAALVIETFGIYLLIPAAIAVSVALALRMQGSKRAKILAGILLCPIALIALYVMTLAADFLALPILPGGHY